MVHNFNLFPKGTGKNPLPVWSTAEPKMVQTNMCTYVLHTYVHNSICAIGAKKDIALFLWANWRAAGVTYRLKTPKQ